MRRRRVRVLDTEYGTWNMDPEALERAFTPCPDVRLIVVAHLYGTPGRLDEIRAMADAHGAIVAEDAAESLGATYKGRQPGTFGDVGAITFNGNNVLLWVSLFAQREQSGFSLHRCLEMAA